MLNVCTCTHTHRHDVYNTCVATCIYFIYIYVCDMYVCTADAVTRDSGDTLFIHYICYMYMYHTLSWHLLLLPTRDPLRQPSLSINFSFLHRLIVFHCVSADVS